MLLTNDYHVLLFDKIQPPLDIYCILLVDLSLAGCGFELSWTTIVIRNGKIVWKVVWLEYYLTILLVLTWGLRYF